MWGCYLLKGVHWILATRAQPSVARRFGAGMRVPWYLVNYTMIEPATVWVTGAAAVDERETRVKGGFVPSCFSYLFPVQQFLSQFTDDSQKKQILYVPQCSTYSSSSYTAVTNTAVVVEQTMVSSIQAPSQTHDSVCCTTSTRLY